MSAIRSPIRDPIGVAALAGIVYAAAVLSWFSSRGVYFSSGDGPTVVAVVGYSVGGLFLVAAVPAYLLARFSLVLPAGATAWFLGNTVYQELYGTHLHPLSSYLTVWPLLFGVAVAAGLVEVTVRVATERLFGRGGLGTLC